MHKKYNITESEKVKDIVDIINYYKFGKFTNMLHVGCGNGEFIEHIEELFEMKVFGIDINQKLISEGLKRNHNLLLSVGDGECMDFFSPPFQSILYKDVLSKIIMPQEALNEAYLRMSENGIVIICDKMIELGEIEAIEIKKSAIMARRQPKSEGSCELRGDLPREYVKEGSFIKRTFLEMIEEMKFTIESFNEKEEYFILVAKKK